MSCKGLTTASNHRAAQCRGVWRVLCHLLSGLLLLMVIATAASAGVTRHDVLVIANSNSPASVAVANYYQAKRNIPPSHVRTISCATAESIYPAAFAAIRDQIKTQLLALGSVPGSPATDPISTIVLCTGIPHIVSDAGECYSAVDTALAGCFTDSPWGKEPLGIYGDYQPAPGFPNPYYRDYNTPLPFEQFRADTAASTSWEAFPSPGFTLVRMLDANTALAAGGGGVLFRGTRSGQAWSWNPVVGKDKANVGWKISSISVLDSTNAYACTGNPSRPHGGGSIIVTSDGGLTWTRIRSALRGAGWKLLDALVGIDFADTSHGWAVGTTQSYVSVPAPPPTPLIIATSNAGASWQNLTSKLPASFFPRSISAGDATHLWICGASGAIYRSADGGNTWSLANTGAPAVDYTAIWIRSSAGAFKGWAAGKGGKIIRTEDGSNWTVEASGLTSSDITDFSAYSQDYACAAYGATSFLTYARPSGWSVEATGLAPIVSAASPGGNSGVAVGGTRYIFADSSSGWSAAFTCADTPWRLRYLVTRLDGYPDDNDGDGLPDAIKAIIDRGCAATAPGKFVLDEATQTDGGSVTPDVFQSAHDRLVSIVGSSQVTWDQNAAFLTHSTGVIGYTSWGMHDTSANAATFFGRPLNTWVNGGIGVVIESTDGRTFRTPFYVWAMYRGGTLYPNKLAMQGWWSYTGFKVALLNSAGAELASGTTVSGSVQIDLTAVSWPADHNTYVQVYFPANDPLHPGGPVDHARYPYSGVSTEAYDNRAAGMTLAFSGIRNLLAEMLKEGASGGMANVDEPWSTYIGDTSYLFPRYAQGYTFAESAYMSLAGIGWQEVIVGDPLMAPYATPPAVSITAPSSDGQIVTGTVRFSATATPNASPGIAKVEFWLDDDTLLTTDTTSPYYVDLNTLTLSDGLHRVEAIAYENDTVQNTGSASRSIISNNNGAIKAKVRDVFPLANGTTVGLQGKKVSAAFSGQFYVEESDRTRGIRVRSSTTVAQGNTVTVTGKLATVTGEREIAADGVFVTAP
jgi:uncharacterized protein (TIGR03790 family)